MFFICQLFVSIWQYGQDWDKNISYDLSDTNFLGGYRDMGGREGKMKEDGTEEGDKP